MRRRLALLVAVIVAPLALSPPTMGRAADPFTFYGSGYGHGLGMSQWGAYGLAKRGWTHQRILTHFYSGTRVAQADQPPRTLRIGLVQGKLRIRLTADGGPVDLRLGSPVDGPAVGTIPDGATWTVRVAGSRYEVDDASGNPVGDPVGGEDQNLYASYAPNGARVKVAETGFTYAHGFLEFNVYNCENACRLRAILPIDPQSYLYGLGEVPSSWPMQAMEAQAVAARTYAFFKVATYGQHRFGCNCALYATAADQVYAGWEKESGEDGDRWIQAVDATDGQVVKYRGEPIQAFYSASSGGYTENNENVWGGTPIPYLRGVCDPGDYTVANPSAIWTVQMTAGQVTKKLRLHIGTVTGFTDIVRGVSGRIVTVTVTGTDGSATVDGWTLRNSLGLQDDRVWINADRHVTGKIRLKYDSLNCRPGLPASRQVGVGGGLRQKFEGGTIYYKEGAGAHELSGAVLDFYLRKGGPSGPLGFPTSDVVRRDNGGTSATFEDGAILCSPAGDCRLKEG